MMHFDKFIQPPVGADLSRTSPIDRPRGLFRYPNDFVKSHHCAPGHESAPHPGAM